MYVRMYLYMYVYIYICIYIYIPLLAFFGVQLDTTLRDIGADAVKTGMLPSQEQVLPLRVRVRERE